MESCTDCEAGAFKYLTIVSQDGQSTSLITTSLGGSTLFIAKLLQTLHKGIAVDQKLMVKYLRKNTFDRLCKELGLRREQILLTAIYNTVAK